MFNVPAFGSEKDEAMKKMIGDISFVCSIIILIGSISQLQGTCRPGIVVLLLFLLLPVLALGTMIGGITAVLFNKKDIFAWGCIAISVINLFLIFPYTFAAVRGGGV